MSGAAPAPSHAAVWRLAGPIVLANLSVPLLGAVDTAVIGHLPDPAYLGGVAVGAVVFGFLYWGFGFLRMGTTGLVAQAMGSGNLDEMRIVLLRALALAGALGLAICILQVPIFWVARTLFGASAEVEAQAQIFFHVRVWSAPASLANFTLIGWFIGVRNTRAALILQLWMNGLNIILSFTFVIGLGWGVAGVATATVISEYAAVIGALVYVLRRLPQRSAVSPARLFEREPLKRLFALNLDIFIRTLGVITAFALFTHQGAGFGDTMLAANAVLLQFQHFLSFGLDGFAHAAEALIGGALGARDRASLRAAVRITGQWALIVALLYAAIYAALGPLIIATLTDIVEVRALAGDFLPWLVLSPIVSVWSFMLDGVFIGATRTSDMRNAMIVSFVIYIVALVALLPLGNHGLWAALMVFMAARAVTLAALYPRLERAADRR
jgi:MATE family multidrug resistance protein